MFIWIQLFLCIWRKSSRPYSSPIPPDQNFKQNDEYKLIQVVMHTSMIYIAAFIKVGGYNELHERYMTAIPNSTLTSNSTCGYPREDSWIMLRDPVNSDMPWPAFLFGQTPASIWYWCADQVNTLQNHRRTMVFFFFAAFYSSLSRGSNH